MDPLTSGDYPNSMRSLVRTRLPKFTAEQSKLLIGSFDFIGLNYYSTTYASDAICIITKKKELVFIFIKSNDLTRRTFACFGVYTHLYSNRFPITFICNNQSKA